MTPRLVFGQISRYHGLFKSSHKVNLHSSHEVLILLALSSGLCTPWAEQMSKYDSFSVQCFPRFLHSQSVKLTAFPTICVPSCLLRPCFYCCFRCCCNYFKYTLFSLWLSLPFFKGYCRQDFKWYQGGSLFRLVIFNP